MSCELTKNASAYIDGELPRDASMQFETHMNGCAECSREIVKLRRISNFISAAGREEVRRPMVWRVQAGRQRLVRFAEILTAAAAIVMVFCGMQLLRNSQHEPESNVSWERIAIGQQTDSTASAALQESTEDPMMQVLFKD